VSKENYLFHQLAKERDTLKEALRLACEDNYSVPSVNGCRLGTECGEDCTTQCKVPHFIEKAKKSGTSAAKD
jgi:hypothetical protein